MTDRYVEDGVQRFQVEIGVMMKHSLSPLEVLVYGFMKTCTVISETNGRLGYIWPTQEGLALKFGVSRKSIGRAIKHLIEEGLLVKESEGTSSGTAPTYTVPTHHCDTPRLKEWGDLGRWYDKGKDEPIRKPGESLTDYLNRIDPYEFNEGEYTEEDWVRAEIEEMPKIP